MTDRPAISQAPARIARRGPGDPAISVVVTSHNYGHFLPACLESLFRQTRPPDQIIVVDDGSTDATAAILAGVVGRVQVIAGANRGQAAAFNAGSRRATGDAVLFLDADDLLFPEAVETVAQYWSDDLAALTFGLATIDAEGRSTGFHAAAAAADQGDNRPRLLATGTFTFPPTSGNVFSRACLAAALPMPEPRWRISADCYLIRAAALFGRFAHVPRLLGAYRLHGGNAHASAGGLPADRLSHAADSRDAADALEDLAAAAGRLARAPDEAEVLSAALRHRARAIREEAAMTVAGPSGTARRAGAAPIGVAALMLPRWPARLVPGHAADLADPATARWFLLPDPEVRPGWKSLAFALDPSPGAQLLTLGLTPARGTPDAPPGIARLWLEGQLAAEAALDGPAELHLRVPRAPWARQRTVRLDIQTVADHGLPHESRLGMLRVNGASPTLPCLTLGALGAPAREFAGVLPLPGWTADADQGLVLAAPEAGLSFAAPASGPAALNLVLDPCPRGWLSLTHAKAGGTLFQGATGAAGWLDIPLPPPDADRCHSLTVRFEPAPDEDRPLRLSGIGLAPTGDALAGAPDAAPPRLNPGETVSFAGTARGASILGRGWETGDGSPSNQAAEACIAFRLPEGCREATVRLAVAPGMDPLPDIDHIVGLSQDGAILAAALLDGRGTVEVGVAAGADGVVRLMLHSVWQARETSEKPSEEAGPTPAPLRLLTLDLTAETSAPPPLPRAGAGLPTPGWLAALDRAGAALADPPGAERTRVLQAARNDLVRFLRECDPAACLIVAATPDRIGRLAAVGAALPADGAPPAELAALSASDRPADRLRAALLSLLLLPAFRAPVAADPATLPAPVFWTPDAWADWLSAPPPVETGDDRDAYVAYLGRLYPALDALIAREPPESAAHRLAAETLARLRSTPAIFGADCLTALVQSRARAIERLLVRRGAALAWESPPRPARDRPRVGVLVRDLLPGPEAWAVTGMYGALDPARFEVILMRMAQAPDAAGAAADTPAGFAADLCLAGKTADQAVAAIRALDLDLFLTGCYATDWEKVTAIQAHRLARVQIWHGAVCPTTGGLSSFDLALSCRATEPPGPERHYAEPLDWIEGPLQCAYAFGPAAPPGSARLRRDIGVTDDAILLTSGALAHKISDELMALWASVLAEEPKAVLVLYPFAQNWSLSFDADRFRARFDRALAAAGVAASRLILLPTQTAAGVRRILAAADLYLDSLPYAGATTVCEALAAGTPVLTCAGDALRGLTGASWVRAYGLGDLVAGSPADYRAGAVRLCRDGAARAEVRARLAARLDLGPPPHCDPDAFGPAFGAALDRIAARHGIAPARSAPRAPALRRRAAARIGRFVILAQPRTASTLLCRMLDRVPGMRCHAELFHDRMIQFHDRQVEDPAALSERDRDRAAFLDRLAAEAAAQGCRLMGFKHFDFFGQDVTDHALADPGTRIVHLSRADLLSQYASLRAAEATGQWFALHGPRRAAHKVVFDRADFESFEQWIANSQRARIDRLARAGRAALLLDFDQVVRGTALDRLAEFLDFAIPASVAAEVDRRYAPDLSERFENPEAVADYRAERGWAD